MTLSLRLFQDAFTVTLVLHPSCAHCLFPKGTTRRFKNAFQLSVFVQRLRFRSSTYKAIGGDDVGHCGATVDGMQNFLNVAIARFSTFVQFDQSEIDTDGQQSCLSLGG